MASTIRVRAGYYQQFDADITNQVPAQSYGGWQDGQIDISAQHTAVVVMHAWAHGSADQFPGWYRAVEYMGRAKEILETVFDPLLTAVRHSPLKLYHVVGGGDYYHQCPGYQRAVALAAKARPAPPPVKVQTDPILDQLQRFRADHIFPGAHNQEDLSEGFKTLHFARQARPIDEEGVAENAEQLIALCLQDDVNHLIYSGFAINWCLLMSPGGMLDMSRRGVMCSVIRQATTAVENKQTARDEQCKRIALWRVALAFGFVFDVDDLISAISG